MWTYFADALAVALALAYAMLQLRWLGTWCSLEAPDGASAARDVARRRDFAVVVPARNEAARIQALVHSVREAAPRTELLIVDDHSDDATAELARRVGASVLVLPKGEGGKKAALTLGIRATRSEWVATLDADTDVSFDWIDALDRYTRPDRVAVAGPVMLTHDGSWFGRWQALDFCGMMAITAASLAQGDFAMGNGANLAFERAAFEAVGGYASPDGRASASGDDMVLLGKLQARFPGRVAFAKTRDAVVETPAQATFGAFVQQRLRWSAKTGLNHQTSLTLVLAAVWAFHVGLLLGPFLAAVGGLSWVTLAGCWGLKLAVDYLLLRSATAFFDRRDLLDATYPLGSLAHALYVAGVGTLALLPVEFEWKGRTHRR